MGFTLSYDEMRVSLISSPVFGVADGVGGIDDRCRLCGIHHLPLARYPPPFAMDPPYAACSTMYRARELEAVHGHPWHSGGMVYHVSGHLCRSRCKWFLLDNTVCLPEDKTENERWKASVEERS